MDTTIVTSPPEISNCLTSASGAPTDIARLLRALFDPPDIIGIRPIETWTDPETKQAQRRILYNAIEYAPAGVLVANGRYWAGLLAFAETEKANLFFAVCPRFGPRDQYERDGARLRWDLQWQIRTVRSLWADLDHCAVDEALTRCDEAGLPSPSVVVRSGHGCHLYWLLDSPYLIDDAGDPPGVSKEYIDRGPDEKRLPRKYAQTATGRVYLFLPDPLTGGDSRRPNPDFRPEVSPKARRIKNLLSGIAAAIKGDHTTDLSRLLRLPGTWNRKDERNGRTPVPCVLVECDAQKRYALEEFARFLPPSSSANSQQEQVAPVQLPTWEQLTQLTRRDRDRLAYLLNKSRTAQDRSKADWALLCWCIRRGIDRELLWEQVQDVGKFAERGRDYFDLTWSNAEERTQETVCQRRSEIHPAIDPTGLCGDGNGPPGDTPDGPDDRPPNRPSILITTREYEVNDQAVAELSEPDAAPEIYQRGNMLVTFHRDSTNPGTFIRPVGTPRIVPLMPARLREFLTRVADFTKIKYEEIVPAHPPDWCVAAVAARGHWPNIRPLEGIVETPTMRSDGSLLDTPGWDPRTGLLFEPNAPYLVVPETPSLADAQAAAAALLDLVTDFPFVARVHSAVWLAGVLTAVVRTAVMGPCPLFLIDGNSSGAGKSLLADLIAWIATGRAMSRTAYPDSEDELRKRITAVALAADRLMLIDNIATDFGGSALDAALTATTWRDRILGRSEMTSELPLHTLWFATANNVTLKGDMTRRVLLCRLEANDERPEERTGFRYPELLEHVRIERARLVCAALTLMRAYVVAGSPDQHLPAFGSFGGWSRIIRSAVHWATGLDPCATREGLRELDPRRNNLALLLAGWDELPGGRTGLTIAEVLKLFSDYSNQVRYARLHAALKEWSRNDFLPSAGAIGARFRSLRGQVLNGMALHASPGHGGAQRWRVIHTGCGVMAGDRG